MWNAGGPLKKDKRIKTNYITKEDNMSAQTLGSLRINRGFNPSKDPKIDEIKQKAGELVDVIENIDPSTCLLYTSPSPRD